MQADRLFLEAAVELARLGQFTCAPNPAVGCIICRDGRVIGRGYHQRSGEAHAEVNAIADAGGRIAGTTVYVTLEPCAFVGRTPACAQTLIDLDVKRVVIGMLDPHPKVSGMGMDMLKQAGIQVELIDIEAAQQLTRGYVSRVVHQRPWVRLKTASSFDGGTALANGDSQWITGTAAREDVQFWRARSDAIITGVGTVLADDPQLNVRDARYQHCLQPLRVVLDSRLRTPSSARLLNDGGPVLLVHDEDVTPRPDVPCLAQPHRDLSTLLATLAERGCNDVLVEAGSTVCASFVAAGLWDEWIMYTAPMWLGEGHQGLVDLPVDKLADAPRGQVVEVTPIGNDLRIKIEARS